MSGSEWAAVFGAQVCLVLLVVLVVMIVRLDRAARRLSDAASDFRDEERCANFKGSGRAPAPASC